MYNSGDAAEQVVRMSLEGAEVALKITGAAAKNLAAALYTVLKDQKKTKGKARIEAMLREKRPLKVYTIKKEDAPEFAKQAKGYFPVHANDRSFVYRNRIYALHSKNSQKRGYHNSWNYFGYSFVHYRDVLDDVSIFCGVRYYRRFYLRVRWI